MTSTEIRFLLRLKGWNRDEEAAARLGVSLRTIYNWKRKGCPRKGEAKRLRRMLEEARRAAS